MTTQFPFTPETYKGERILPIELCSVLKQRLKELRTFIKDNPPKAKVNSNSYKFYTKEDNPELFIKLESCGFFDFHRSNQAKVIVMEHQVNKFVFGSGWKYYLKGYTCLKDHVEIHHLDGDVQNNNPKNLAYVSPQVNKLCATACDLKYLGKVKHKMKESMSQAAKMIALSVKRYYKRVLGKVINIPAVQWLLSLPMSLNNSVDVDWQVPAKLRLQSFIASCSN